MVTKRDTTKLYKEIDWLKTRRDYLNIFKIEKELEMPANTLRKFVDGERGLAEQWHDPVMFWVKKFKK